MEDDQTGSLWSQISGECIKGDLVGESLELYPSQFAAFAAVKDRPNIHFLIKPEGGADQSVYREYFENRGRMGIFGTMYSDTLLDGKDLVYGIRGGDMTIALPQGLFEQTPAYLVTIGDSLLIVISGRNGIDVGCFRLPAPADTPVELTFAESDRIIVTSSEFDRIVLEKGRQISGRELEPYPVITAYWFAWKSFFPTTEIFQP